MQAGGTLSFAGLTWTITLVDPRGGHVRYTIQPNQGRPSEDDRLLTFEWGASDPVPYYFASGHYNHPWTNGNVQGFQGDTYDPATVVLNDNAYGVDINVDEFTISPDWDFM